MAKLFIQHILNLFFATSSLVGFWGVGRIARKRLFTLPEELLITITDFAVGCWLFWTIIFLVGLAGGYRQSIAITLWLGLVIAAGSQLWAVRNEIFSSKTLFKCNSKYELTLAFISTIVVILAIIGALTPPAAQDALVHHLSMPKDYIKAGRIVELPYNYFSYFPAGAEMLFLYGMLLYNAGVATLIHLGFGLATFLSIIAGGRQLGLSSRATWLAATAFITVPTIWMEMTWAYIDLALTFYLTLMMLLLLKYREHHQLDWLKLAGFALGGGLSIKYTSLYAVVIAPLLLLFILKEHKEKSTTIIVKTLLTPAIAAFIVCVMWYIRNTIYTGNPLFPFLLNIIPSHNIGWDLERASQALTVLGRYGGEHKTIADYLLVPFKLCFLARYESTVYYQGIIGAFYIFTLVLLPLIKYLRKEIYYLLGFSIFFYLFWLFSSQQIRYLLPILPCLALAIASLETLAATQSLSRWWRIGQKLFLTLALLIFGINLTIIGNYFYVFGYPQVCFGQRSTADYLRRKFDYYATYEYINQNTPANSRIFLIVMSNQPYYLERDYFGDSAFEDFTITKIVREAKTSEDILAGLKERGITHLAYRPAILFGASTTPFSADEYNKFVAFAVKYCQILSYNDKVALLAINS